MKSPFPGMDPYLERHWRDVHASIVIYARDAIQGNLPGDLLARVEERVFVETEQGEPRNMYPDLRLVEYPPGEKSPGAAPSGVGITVAEPIVMHFADEPVTETYVAIVDAGSGNRVVTVIEFLSPSNKVPGEGQSLYLRKLQELKQGQASLVEIDLLRAGRRLLSIAPHSIPANVRTAYQVCVRRGWQPLMAEIYRVPLHNRLPIIKVPLRESDPDVPLDLQALIDQAYRNGRYQTINYRVPPEPPLDGQDAAWADDLLRKAGLRQN